MLCSLKSDLATVTAVENGEWRMRWRDRRSERSADTGDYWIAGDEHGKPQSNTEPWLG